MRRQTPVLLASSEVQTTPAGGVEHRPPPLLVALVLLDMQPANTRVIAAAGAVMTRLAAGSRAGRGHDRVSGEPVDHPET